MKNPLQSRRAVSFDHRVALGTGAGQGLGAATVRELAARARRW